MLSQKHYWLMALAIACGTIFSVVTRADEKEANKDREPAKRALALRVATTSKYWIGIHAMPIDEALKSQLGLPNRLIVHHVLPNSPAAAAGVQNHDILLKFGDREISTLEDLVKAVDESGQKESTLVVLRGGK